MSSAPADHESPDWLKVGLGSLVWRITPDCREVTRLTSEERDHALPFGTRTRLYLHRVFCEYCARYAQQLEFLHQASQRLPEYLERNSTPDLSADAKSRLKRALQEQAPRE
ncbi:MAG: hypothetical protein ACAI37_25825 [Chthoniobacter sp.]